MLFKGTFLWLWALGIGVSCSWQIGAASSSRRVICDCGSQRDGKWAEHPGKLHGKGKAKLLFVQMQTFRSARSDCSCVCNSSQDWFRCILVVLLLCHSQCCSAAQLLTSLCNSGISCLIQDWPEWIQIHPNWLTKLMNFPCNKSRPTLSRTVWAAQPGRAGTSCCTVQSESSQTLRAEWVKWRRNCKRTKLWLGTS